MTRSIKVLAQEALAIQDASNLSGLVHGFARAIEELRANLPNIGTAELNTHPICQMWVCKLHDLARMGISDMDAFEKAYLTTQELAK